MPAGGRILAVLGAVGLSVLTCVIGWALLEAFHLPIRSRWRWTPELGSVVVLGAGLSLVFARARAPWWEVTLAVVLCSMVAFVADVYIVFLHIFI